MENISFVLIIRYLIVMVWAVGTPTHVLEAFENKSDKPITTLTTLMIKVYMVYWLFNTVDKF